MKWKQKKSASATSVQRKRSRRHATQKANRSDRIDRERTNPWTSLWRRGKGATK